MAYSTTKYSAQFSHRLLDRIQTYIEASLTTALTELDSTLEAFADYRTPIAIALNFPALFLSLGPSKMNQSDDDSHVNSTNQFFVELAIVGKDQYTLERNLAKYFLAIDRVLRTAGQSDIAGSVSTSLTKAVWEPTEWEPNQTLVRDTIYYVSGRITFVVQLLER